MKIVINKCFGGFSVSKEFAVTELGIVDCSKYGYRDDSLRTDPRVIAAVESGRDINGECAKLAVVEIPDDAKWYIVEYDGLEHVAEGRTWR